MALSMYIKALCQRFGRDMKYMDWALSNSTRKSAWSYGPHTLFLKVRRCLRRTAAWISIASWIFRMLTVNIDELLMNLIGELLREMFFIAILLRWIYRKWIIGLHFTCFLDQYAELWDTLHKLRVIKSYQMIFWLRNPCFTDLNISHRGDFLSWEHSFCKASE